jgi:hypothetical protein
MHVHYGVVLLQGMQVGFFENHAVGAVHPGLFLTGAPRSPEFP